MNEPTIPGDGLALVRALRMNEKRQLREASEARLHARLVTATGIDPVKLSAQGQRTLAWLSGGDDSTVDGLVEILGTCGGSVTSMTPASTTRRAGTVAFQVRLQ